MRDRINRDEGKDYSDSMVYKVMKYLGIRSRVRRQRNSCTINAKNARRAKNIPGRDFSASRPNEKWVTDVTEFKYYIGSRVMKIFLSAIIDLYDRSVIAFVLSDSNDNRLVFETFRKAVSNNPDCPSAVPLRCWFSVHEPRLRAYARGAGNGTGMSRIGCCIDNGVCEAFWSFINTEALASEVPAVYPIPENKRIEKYKQDHYHS